MAKIVVNNTSYNNIEEMPPEVRQAYERAMGILADKNGNGMPDILEGALPAGNIAVRVASKLDTCFVVDGKVYMSVDELPPEARQKYDHAMVSAGQALGDANQNGVPDILEGMFPARPASSISPTDRIPVVKTDGVVLSSASPIIGDPPRNSGVGLLPIVNIAVAILLIALVVFGVFVILPLFR
jgi:hypothetical protein